MKKSRFFLLFLLILLLVPLGAGAAILDELPLEKGATGQSVVMLQQRLIDLGYLHFRPTGSYGDMTKSAVASFQARNGISSKAFLARTLFPSSIAGALRARQATPGFQESSARAGRASRSRGNWQIGRR